MTSLIISRSRRAAPSPTTRKVVDGFKLPDNRPLTSNELAWIEMLRVIAGDQDPPPSLVAVQALRRALRE